MLKLKFKDIISRMKSPAIRLNQIRIPVDVSTELNISQEKIVAFIVFKLFS